MWTGPAPQPNRSITPLSLPFQLSGLCQLDDSYETSKSVQETGESIQGEKEGGEEEDT